MTVFQLLIAILQRSLLKRLVIWDLYWSIWWWLMSAWVKKFRKAG